jgi:hypothetical protein
VLQKDSLENRRPWRAALPAGLHAEAVRAQVPDLNAALPAATPGAIAPGSVAISGFSGTTLSAESFAPVVDPTDKTIIDVEGASLKAFDQTALGQPPALLLPGGTRYVGGVCRRGAFPIPVTPGGGQPVSCPASLPVGWPTYCCPPGRAISAGAAGASSARAQTGACPASLPIGRPPYC